MVEFDYSPDFQDDRLTMYNNAWTQSSHASRRWAVYGYPECTFASISICRVLVQAEVFPVGSVWLESPLSQ